MKKDSPRHEDLPDDLDGITFGQGPDGLPFPSVQTIQRAPLPPRTPENMVCLRGPCRHYWHLVTTGDFANTDGDFKQHHHVCLVNPGYETNLEGSDVADCGKWDPLTRRELVKIRKRRAAYNKTQKEK